MIKLRGKITSLSRKSKGIFWLCLDNLTIWLSLIIVWPWSGVSNFETFAIFGCLASFSTLFSLYGLGVYRIALSQASTDLALKVAVGAVPSAVTLLIALIYSVVHISITDPLIFWVLVYSGIVTVRFGLRSLLSEMNESRREMVAIYGAGVAGKLLLRALKQSEHYKVVLLIDDSKPLHGEIISGLEVRSFTDSQKHLKRLGVKTVLLAMPSVEEKVRQNISESINALSIKTKTIPNFYELIVGNSGITALSELSTSDLLGRKSMRAHTELIDARINGKAVLVTGAGGSIGSELCRQIVGYGPRRLVIFDVSEAALFSIIEELDGWSKEKGSHLTPIVGSILDEDLINAVFEKFNINTVYHSAAYKHVPLMEKNVIQVFKNNVLGTALLTKYSKKYGVENFTLISTDKAVNPTNVMGASKRLAEMLCLAAGEVESQTLFNVVRFGNVLGSSGSVVPTFVEQIKNGGPVTVTDVAMTRFFMTIPEASQLVLQASGLAKDGNIFVLNMGESIRIVDLAERLIRLFGKVPVEFGLKVNDSEVEIKFTGVRPGEKLFEELTFSECDLKNTSHPMIFTAMESPINCEEIDRKTKQLGSLLSERDFKGLFEFLAEDFPNIANLARSEDVFLKETINDLSEKR